MCGTVELVQSRLGEGILPSHLRTMYGFANPTTSCDNNTNASTSDASTASADAICTQ